MIKIECAVFLVLSAVLFSLTGYIHDARAELEIGAGMSRFDPSPNGVWYQDGLPNEKHMQNPAFSVGWRAPNWRAGVMDWGRASIDATALADDKRYAEGVRSCKSDQCYAFTGASHMQGVYAQYRLQASNGFTAEIGPTLYRIRFHEVAQTPCGPVVLPYTAAWHVGAMAGIGYTRGRFAFMVDVSTVDAHGRNDTDVPVNVHQKVITAQLRIAL